MSLASMFHKRGDRFEYIRPGSTFRRIHPDAVVQTAKIVSVASGNFGIPHVLYNVSFQHLARRFHEENLRTLALRSFADRYTERVTT